MLYIPKPIDLASAVSCRAAIIAHEFDYHKSLLKKEAVREFVDACDKVIAGELAFDTAFPHGCESTYLYICFH